MIEIKKAIDGAYKEVSMLCEYTSKDETRKPIQMILVERFEDGSFTAVATDGRRMRVLRYEEYNMPASLFQIPSGLYQWRKAAKSIFLIPDADGQTFPNWRAVVPEDATRARSCIAFLAAAMVAKELGVYVDIALCKFTSDRVTAYSFEGKTPICFIDGDALCIVSQTNAEVLTLDAVPKAFDKWTIQNKKEVSA